ncbi:MAG: hypothetical protein ACLPWF_16720 [Bryobacteraceae bacterium]
MIIFKIPAAVLLALATSAIPIFAQWPSYPTPGPRTTDGKIDFSAPPPRTANGKPDFSGLWEPAHTNKAGLGPGGGMNGTAPLPFAIPTSPDDPPVAQFFNIGGGFKDHLLPFTEWATALRAQRKGDGNKDNPDALCLPLGLTQLHMHPQPREVVQTPREIVVLYEANGNVRRILTDGRPLPNNDPTPWFYGYSVAHWDGDTLVVETTGFRDDVWLDVEGSPLTSSGKMTERWRRVKYGLMQIDITIEDPKAYTKPFTVRVNHQLMPDTELMEFVCQDRDAPHYVGKTGSK